MWGRGGHAHPVPTSGSLYKVTTTDSVGWNGGCEAFEDRRPYPVGTASCQSSNDLSTVGMTSPETLVVPGFSRVSHSLSHINKYIFEKYVASLQMMLGSNNLGFQELLAGFWQCCPQHNPYLFGDSSRSVNLRMLPEVRSIISIVPKDYEFK